MFLSFHKLSSCLGLCVFQNITLNFSVPNRKKEYVLFLNGCYILKTDGKLIKTINKPMIWHVLGSRLKCIFYIPYFNTHLDVL